VRSLIVMAHNLNLKVIAEGVETAEQLAFLRDNACDAIQGFLVSRPVPAEEITPELLARPLVPRPWHPSLTA
jgi:diguanylate cyclase